MNDKILTIIPPATEVSGAEYCKRKSQQKNFTRFANIPVHSNNKTTNVTIKPDIAFFIFI